MPTTTKKDGLNDDLARRFFEDGERVAAGVTIQRSAPDLYNAWTSWEDLPRFIDDVESVVRNGDTLTWSVRGPGNQTFTWDAAIINEVPDRVIAWRTNGDSQVENAGSISFRERPYQRGTEVHVVIEYLPPGGKIGSAIASMLGKDPATLLKRGLFRFRQLMESGEIATVTGQPVGSNRSAADKQDDKARKTDPDVRDIAAGRARKEAS